jgi:glucose/arabinose dehydrogenase
MLRIILTALISTLIVTTSALALPAGYSQQAYYNGELYNPIAARFAPDGRVFIVEKAGVIKTAATVGGPLTTVVDIRADVHDYWDRGLTSLAVHPQWPTQPYLYILYSYDAPPGQVAPYWRDACPSPPGPTEGGCVVEGRLERVQVNVSTWTVAGRTLLVRDWCQQYPSHSVGDLQFGPDGYLYASGGEGASFTFTDYGQGGSPANPCSDPYTGSPSTSEGGALRAQDRLTTGDPQSLSGALIRIDPVTGLGASSNPEYSSSDPNRQRLLAYGFRNPLRFTFRPLTSEVWLGDVGSSSWEEINWVPPSSSVLNYGWPCREGPNRLTAWSQISLCASRFTGATEPIYSYPHLLPIDVNETCEQGGSSITGIAFQRNPQWPARHRALYFADYSRGCIWYLASGIDDWPDHDQHVYFTRAPGITDLQVGPDGSMYYPTLRTDGALNRITYYGANSPPAVKPTYSPQSGLIPLTVAFQAGAQDPDGDPLTYSWDLDADGIYGDSALANPIYTYWGNGIYEVHVLVSDGQGNTVKSETMKVQVGNTAPTMTILSPTSTTRWTVGSTVSMSFAASDREGPATVSWRVIMQHCPDAGCHEHAILAGSGASASFVAPDHEYPSYLTIEATATDSWGLQTTRSVDIQPRVVALKFQSDPRGAAILVGDRTASGSSLTVNALVGGTIGIQAPATYAGLPWSSWSQGGARIQTLRVPTRGQTYTARYRALTTLSISGSGTAKSGRVSCKRSCKISSQSKSVSIRALPARPGTRIRWQGCQRVRGQVCTVKAGKRVALRFQRALIKPAR